MKTLLTIIACRGCEEYGESDNGIQFICPQENEDDTNFLSRAVKEAKGKYAIVTDRSFELADVQSILNITDKNSADLICFVGGNAIKTSILKGLRDFTDPFSFRILGITGCKGLLKTVYTPLKFSKESTVFYEGDVEGIRRASEAFVKIKAKLTKEIYSLAFSMICDKIVLYYLSAMLEIRNGTLQAEKLIEFDNKLKAEIVLYLAVQKRFTYANLDKLRENGFKISWFTQRKFRKALGK